MSENEETAVNESKNETSEAPAADTSAAQESVSENVEAPKIPVHDLNEQLVATVFKMTDSPAVTLVYSNGERHGFMNMEEACKGLTAAAES